MVNGTEIGKGNEKSKLTNTYKGNEVVENYGHAHPG